jgi:hypothetical protein
MIDYKIVVRKGNFGTILLYEYNKDEAEKEATKFRNGLYLRELIKCGFKVYVEEVKDN